jgi:hypothetical protein
VELKGGIMEEKDKKNRVIFLGTVMVGGDEGEWPNGTRVRKINSEPDDTHQDGAECTIVGALGPIPDNQRAGMILEMAKMGLEGEVLFIYWVIWDDIPGIPVAISDFRLEKIEE